MGRFSLKALSLTFVLAAAACAKTPPPKTVNVNLDPCLGIREDVVEKKNGETLRTEQPVWDDSCAVARSAEILARGQTAEGKPDIAQQAAAIAIVDESTPKVREYFERMIARDHLTIEQLRAARRQFDVETREQLKGMVEAETPYACGPADQRMKDGTVKKMYRCVKKPGGGVPVEELAPYPATPPVPPQNQPAKPAPQKQKPPVRGNDGTRR